MPGQLVAVPIACTGSLLTNTSSNGQSTHGDQISLRMAIFARIGNADHMIAYEYQNYAGHEVLQFLDSSSVTLIPFHGSVYNALQKYANVMGISMAQLPDRLRQIKRDTPIRRILCRA